MLDILIGHEGSAAMKSVALNSATDVINEGEWVVFDATSGGVKKAGATWDPGTDGPAFPVWGGTTRLDSKQMKAVTVCFGKGYYAETDKFAAVTIKPGDPLTLANGVLTKATITSSTIDQKVIAWATSPNASGRLQFVVI